MDRKKKKTMIESLENRKFKFRQVLNFPSSESDRQ